MAEILLKIRDGSNYSDGDVLAAWTWRAVRQCHASLQCSRYVPEERTRDGLLKRGTLAEVWYQETMPYRYERIGKDRIRRTNLRTSAVFEYGSAAVEDPETGRIIACDVERLFRHLCRNPRNVVFGEPGREVYYEAPANGHADYSLAAMDGVWAAITERTGRRDTDFPYMPLSQVQLKTSLVVPAEDCDDETAAALSEPLRTSEELTIVSVSETSRIGDAKTYEIAADRSLAKIVRVESVTIAGEDVDARPDETGKWVLAAKQAPADSTMLVTGVVLKRERFCAWRDILAAQKVGVSEADALNRRKAVDLRTRIQPQKHDILARKVA